MKKKITLLSVACLIGFGMFAQDAEGINYNRSLGIEFRKGDLNTVGLNYRKSYEKYNLKIGVFFGTSTNTNFTTDNYFFETGDTSRPVISIEPRGSVEKSAQTIQIGIERRIPYTGIDFLVGADLFFGHRIQSNSSQVVEVDKINFTENDQMYYRYNYPNNIPIDQSRYLNQLTSTYSYFVTGLNVNLGVSFDLGERIQIMGLVNYRIQSMNHYNNSFSYSSDDFKEHLPTENGVNLFEVEFIPSISANYRF